MFDPTALVLADHPSVWRVPTEEELLVCGERDRYGNWTPAAKAMQEKLALDRWYLVRNDHRIRVRGQATASEYITRLGIEYPVYGLDGVYRLYSSLVNHDGYARDTAMRAFRLGAIVPVSLADAQRYYDRTVDRVGRHLPPARLEALLGPRPGGWEGLHR